MKIERLLTMTIMLLNRRKVTAKELADHFDVTVRTIYRDVETLNASGIPVISYQGYEGGFCIAENFKLSRQLLTFDDIVQLLSLLKGINRTLKNREVHSVIEKITALIPSDKEEEYEQHSSSFIIDISSWGSSSRYDQLISDLHRSVADSNLIQFKYITAQGTISERTVEPHTMVLKSFTWYLIGFCRLRQEFRIFRLSRIRECNLSSERFVRREFDPYSFFQEKGNSRPMVTLRLRFSTRIAFRIEEMFSEYILNRDAKYLLVEFTIPDDEWIYGMILNYGNDVEVLEPPHVRNAIIKKIEKLKEVYSNLT